MREDQLRLKLEELGVATDKIDEAVSVIAETVSPSDEAVDNSGDKLREEYDLAEDWRIKAKIAAKIISKELST